MILKESLGYLDVVGAFEICFYADTTYIPLPNRIISKNKRNIA